jgi:hypothetical protein
MWTSGFFVSKVILPFSNVHQIVSIFLWIVIYFTRKDPFVQNIPKIKYIYLFRFWYSNIFKHYYSFEFVIMVESEVMDLTII